LESDKYLNYTRHPSTAFCYNLLVQNNTVSFQPYSLT